MTSQPYGDHLETRILSATPLELVCILYDAMLASIGRARRALERGEVLERSRAVTHAVEIVYELGHSLNHDAGGELSVRLGALYEYVQRRLLEANLEQDDAGLAEAECLLSILAEAWRELPAAAAAASSSRWESRGPDQAFGPEAVAAANATHRWSA
jgi:flagellar protein FliS